MAYKTLSNEGVILNHTSSLGLNVKSDMINHSAASGGFITAAMAFSVSNVF
jgi:hypothetical protein